MLAGCSSLLSPRHTKPSTQFQACHFPSMSTQRLDLPCNPNRAQPVKPVRPVTPVSSLSIDNNPIEARTCSLKHNVARPGNKRSKRLYEDEQDGSFRAKRKRGCGKVNEFGDQLGSGSFWYPSNVISPNLTTSPWSFVSELADLGEPDRQRDANELAGSGSFWYPSNVISPNLTTSPWSFVNELADLGEPDRQRAANESSSGSGSGSQESHQSLNLDPQEGNPNVGPPNPNQSLDLLAIGTETHDEEVGFELISLLLACLEAISMKNIPAINHFISKLGELANPRGDSSITRLGSYYTEALALRVSRIWPNIFQISTPRELIEEDNGSSLQILNQATPIPKFIHFTSNEILLRSFEGKDKVHIIDFDIKNGLQWPSFFQSLASRTNPPTCVRITGIGESKQDLIETRARLAGIAESLNLEFEFHPVVDRLEDVRLWMLHVKEGETVGINCVFQLHKLLYDHTGCAVKDFLGLIRSVNPSVVVVVEQESEHNEVGLEPRVVNSLKYYSAIFDCIEESFGSTNGNRVKIEELFGREIRNIIACEGLERFERHVGFDQWWRSLTELGGFRNAGINEREFVQSEMIIRMYHHSYGPGSFKVEKKRFDGGATAGITLTWSGQPLYTVSAWVPDVTGASGSYQLQQEEEAAA